jgi:hypothetical protein
MASTINRSGLLSGARTPTRQQPHSRRCGAPATIRPLSSSSFSQTAFLSPVACARARRSDRRFRLACMSSSPTASLTPQSRRPDSNRGPLHYECRENTASQLSHVTSTALKCSQVTSHLRSSGHISGHIWNRRDQPADKPSVSHAWRAVSAAGSSPAWSRRSRSPVTMAVARAEIASATR